MNRRKFLDNTTLLASSALIAGMVPFRVGANLTPQQADMVVWSGLDYYRGVRDAIAAAGGISRYVPDHSTIALLVNSRFELKGTLVNPDITIALVEMLLETHPKEIVFLQLVDQAYWDMSPYQPFIADHSATISQVMSNAFPSTFNEEDFILLPEVPGAKHLKEIEVVKRLFGVDVFINVPLIKHHPLTLMTGALKNMMGISTRKTNVTFHLDGPVKNDPGYLGQCISDLNLLRKPDLIVADATELIVTNGPSGPGDLITPNKILVGNDPVAIDSFGSGIMGLDPHDVHSLVCAHAAGLGEINPEKWNLLEINS